MEEMKYIELCLVKQGATPEGHQDFLALEQINEESFAKKKGNIGVRFGKKKIKSQILPMSEWDLELKRYLSQGYMIVPGKKAPSVKREVKKSDDFAPEKNSFVQDFVDYFRALAYQSVNDTFTVSVEDLTKEQIEEAKKYVRKLLEDYEDMSLKEFNDLLCRYYMTIPRRMRKLSDHLASGKNKLGVPLSEEGAREEKKLIAEKEASRFETIIQLLGDTEMANLKKTFSESYDLEITEPTEEEIAYIKRKMTGQADKFLRAWKVTNKKTEKAFDDFCRKHDLSDENKGIAHLFHGSPGENWLSIMCGGLSCYPRNVFTGAEPRICGKAYGIGIYTAKDAVKSMGYADTRSAKWNTGCSETGFLAITKVAVGKPKTQYNGEGGIDSTFNWDKLQKRKPGALCTWAECRYSGFMMDEIIVYNDPQITIEYIVEFAG